MKRQSCVNLVILRSWHHLSEKAHQQLAVNRFTHAEKRGPQTSSELCTLQITKCGLIPRDAQRGFIAEQ